MCHSLRWCVSLCVSIRQNNTTHTHTCFQNILNTTLTYMFSGHKIFSSRYLTLSLSLRFSVFLAWYYIYLVYLSTKRYTQHTYTYTHIRTLFPSSLSPSRCARVYCVWCDFSSMCVSRSRSVTRVHMFYLYLRVWLYMQCYIPYTHKLCFARAHTLSLSNTHTNTNSNSRCVLMLCECVSDA